MHNCIRESASLFYAFHNAEQGNLARACSVVISVQSKRWFLAMMEMILQGVSTRRVEKITEDLCGERFSKSMVSRLCANLQARVDG